MTPAIKVAIKAKVNHRVHEYKHDPKAESYGTEAAEAIGIEPGRVFKTLLVELNGDNKKLAVGVVPVSGQLDLKAIASALKVNMSAGKRGLEIEMSAADLLRLTQGISAAIGRG